MSVIAVTCDVLLALSRTRENSPIPKAGAFTTETVGSVIGLFAGDGSVVSNLIIDLVDIGARCGRRAAREALLQVELVRYDMPVLLKSFRFLPQNLALRPARAARAARFQRRHAPLHALRVRNVSLLYFLVRF